jgi:hypothetical protein
VKKPHQKALFTPSGKPKPDEYLQGILEKSRKGTYMGLCRPTACPRSPATWYNPNMANDIRGPEHAYYCAPCGIILNRENKHHEFWKLCYEGPRKD